MNDTELRLQYSERTWDYQLPDNLENAIENDYVQNSVIYTDEVFAYIRTLYLISPEISENKLLESAHEFYQINLVELL